LDTDGNSFEYVKPEAIEWYKRKSKQLSEENNGPVM
jgi:hypothetical protein